MHVHVRVEAKIAVYRNFHLTISWNVFTRESTSQHQQISSVQFIYVCSVHDLSRNIKYIILTLIYEINILSDIAYYD